MTSLYLPDPKLLQKTNHVDYYHWNYQFPIKYIQRFRLRAVLKLMGNKIYDRLLEVGTGSGVFLPELARHCRKLYAVDIHDNMKAVKELCRSTSTQSELVRCSAERTSFPDDMFDMIVAVSVLEFVEDLNCALQELRRILSPGGLFVTICPQQGVWLDFVLSIYSRRPPNEEFRDSRSKVSPMLKVYFNVVEKRTFPPIIGRAFPVYHYYKLSKQSNF